jgi:hypothetical protein
MANSKLTIDDIVDLRAYERERDAFRTQIIELKKQRRVPVGPLVTMVFESRDTVRFQIQEMARAERMLTDEAIQAELDAYNPLIPEPGHLSATLFIELTSKAELLEWLPKLVGIERAVELRLGPGDRIRAQVDQDHAAQLTRDEITASVHYLQFALSPQQIAQFEAQPVSLAIALPAYEHSTVLADSTRAALLGDVRA